MANIIITLLTKIKDIIVWIIKRLLEHVPFIRKDAPKEGEGGELESGLDEEPSKGLDHAPAEPGLEEPDLEGPGLEEPSLEEPDFGEPSLEEPDFRSESSGFGTPEPAPPAPAQPASQSIPGTSDSQFENLKLGMGNIEEMIENLNRRFDTLGSSIDLMSSQGEFDKSVLQRHDSVLREMSEKIDLLQKQHQAMWDSMSKEENKED